MRIISPGYSVALGCFRAVYPVVPGCPEDPGCPEEEHAGREALAVPQAMEQVMEQELATALACPMVPAWRVEGPVVVEVRARVMWELEAANALPVGLKALD